MTAAQVVDADDVKATRIERLAGTDHIVPPADVVGIVGIATCDVVRRIERMAHQHRIRPVGIKRAVRLVNELVAVQRRPAPEP